MMDERLLWPPPSFHVLAKPSGAICNLDCGYCYYLDKSDLYPGPPARMSEEVLESFVRQYIEAQRAPEVVFAWQGGEPTLMGLDFYRRAVELQREHLPRGMRLLNTIQTNGVLVDDPWASFFAANEFLVGISIDGPAPLHDAFRPDKGGGATFERTMHGLERLRACGVEFNVLAAVHAANAARPLETYRFLRDEAGARFIQFLPIVEKSAAGGKAGGRSVGARAFGAFLSAVFDEWVTRDVGRVFVQAFDTALASWAGVRPGLCVFEATCGAALVLEHNGDLYSCDHFVDREHLLGNILRTPLRSLVGSDRQRRFGRAKEESLPSFCRRCPVLFACRGGCPKDRIIETPDGERGLNYLCEGYRMFFEHIDVPMRFMAAEVLAGRPAARVMDACTPERSGGRSE